jgi:hypothetical protein
VDDRTTLLKEMNEGRRMLLLAMADLEEEQGDAQRAAGWRWLAVHDRWPLLVVRPSEERDEKYVVLQAGWEWWRLKVDAQFSCSLPALLMDSVRKRAETPRGLTCRFESPSQALGCAATCAGMLIANDLLEKP